jgi:fructuronate reductase
MKVCTCLNPLHTVLAVFGCLLGYKSISDEMKDKNLKAFIEKVGYVEGMPVVVDPIIINAMDFIRETIEVRFPNPFVPDTPQRIATDTSKKISVRFGETLKAYIREGKKDLSFLTFIPLFFAGWLRYLMSIDDLGNEFEISPDPNADEVKQYVEGISLGDTGSVSKKIRPLLSDSNIFGINLYEYGLGEKVEGMFLELISGKGAVKNTIEKYLSF